MTFLEQSPFVTPGSQAARSSGLTSFCKTPLHSAGIGGTDPSERVRKDCCGKLKHGSFWHDITALTLIDGVQNHWSCVARMSAELGQDGLPVVLHVDSQYAISSVNDHERPADNEEAVHCARATKCTLGTLSAVTFEWIAGNGHPWNELADVAAKQTAHLQRVQRVMLVMWTSC